MKKFKYLEAPDNFLSVKKEEMDEFYANAIYLGWYILSSKYLMPYDGYYWQDYVVEKLKAHFNITNPLNKTYLYTPPDIKLQKYWEYDNMRKCKNVFFFIGPEFIDSYNAFELGALLERNTQNMYIYCNKENKGKTQIEEQAHKKWKPVYNDLDYVISKIIDSKK